MVNLPHQLVYRDARANFAAMNALAPALNVPHKHVMTVDEFITLNDSGAFDGFSKSELIEGEMICLNSQFSRHARIKSLLLTELNIALRVLDHDLQAWSEASVRLSDHSLPEPDIVLTRYRGEGAVPLDTVALLVEVADTTLSNDLGRKASIYARHGIPEYWVVDVDCGTIHQMWACAGEAYAERRTIAFGDPVEAATLAGVTVPTGALD